MLREERLQGVTRKQLRRRVLAAYERQDYAFMLLFEPLTLDKAANAVLVPPEHLVSERYVELSTFLTEDTTAEAKQALTALSHALETLQDAGLRAEYEASQTKKLSRAHAAAHGLIYTERVAEKLWAATADERWVALCKIQTMAGFSAFHARIAQLASDAEVQLRCEAVRALGAMSGGGGVPHVEAVLAALAAGRKTHDLHMCRVALAALGAMGPNARFWAPEVAELLRHRDATVRDATLRALGAMNARAYLPAMLSMLKDPDAMVRASAVTALVGLTDCAEAVAVKVVELLMCDDRTTRTLAVSLLARLGEPVAAFASDVVRVMEHAQPGVREAAVEVMCHLLRWPAAAHHVANLVPLLADDDACVRAAVVAGFRGGSLGRRTLALAAEKVLELMGYVDLPRDEQRAYAGVCRSAQQCLNAILSVTDEPAPLMQLAQQHSNPVICQAVMDVLAVMAAPQLLAHADYVRSVLLENAESTVRERGLGLLQACGAAAKPLAPSMRLLLADTHASVRGAALHALAALGPAAAAEEVEAVRALVRHGDAVTRKAAEAALEAMAPGSQPRRVGLVDGLDRHYFQLVHAPPGSGYRPKGHRGDEKVVGVAPEEPPFNVQPGEPYILDGIAVGTGNWVEPWQYAIKELPMSTT